MSPRRVVVVGLAVALVACGNPREDGASADGGGRVLAEVNGVKITEEAFLERVRSGGASSIARAKTKTGRRAILDSMIRTELLWQEAQKRGVRHDRQVRDAINPTLVKRLLGEEFEKTVSIDQVEDSAIERIYRDRWDEFHFPEVYRLGVMKLRDRAAADVMMKRLADAHNDEDVFEMLASGPENLDDHLRASEGNIGYLPLDRLREAVPPHLRETFDRIKGTDEEPEIVENSEGTFIVMMTGHRPSVVRELAEVREGLRQQAFRELREKRLNEFVAHFKKRHDVEIHYERLDDIPQYEPARPAPTKAPPPTAREADGGADSHPSRQGSSASKRP